jgi:hypothetical protein
MGGRVDRNTQHAQAERIASAANARLEALTRTLAAIDGSLADRAA